MYVRRFEIFVIIMRFIRLTGRVLAWGWILGFATAVWHSGRAIVDSMPAEDSTRREASPAGAGEPSHESQWLPSRQSRRERLAEEDRAARKAAFEDFRRRSEDFWEQEYARALASARERIERETEEALRIARRTNAAGHRQAEQVAAKTNAEHWEAARRLAEEQSEASARALERITRGEEAAAGLTREGSSPEADDMRQHSRESQEATRQTESPEMRR